MRRNMRILLVVALMISLAGTALVYAGRLHGRHAPFGSELTEEQREAVHTRIHEMRESGAPREEIHEAVRGMLEGYGVTPPEGPPEGRHRGRGPGGPFGSELTEEQREAIHTRIHEMRESGASREEIHTAIRAMLEEYGIELPDCPQGDGASSRAGRLGDGPQEGRRWGEIKGRF
jgi:DNA-binding transcriptional regulator YhcF (GntR family)